MNEQAPQVQPIVWEMLGFAVVQPNLQDPTRAAITLLRGIMLILKLSRGIVIQMFIIPLTRTNVLVNWAELVIAPETKLFDLLSVAK